MVSVDPEQVIERMERLVAESSTEVRETESLNGVDPVARKHRAVVRRGAEREDE